MHPACSAAAGLRGRDHRGWTILAAYAHRYSVEEIHTSTRARSRAAPLHSEPQGYIYSVTFEARADDGTWGDGPDLAPDGGSSRDWHCSPFCRSHRVHRTVRQDASSGRAFPMLYKPSCLQLQQAVVCHRMSHGRGTPHVHVPYVKHKPGSAFPLGPLRVMSDPRTLMHA